MEVKVAIKSGENGDRHYTKPNTNPHGETELKESVKEAGAYWDIKKRCWKLSYRMVSVLMLDNRVINELDPLE